MLCMCVHTDIRTQAHTHTLSLALPLFLPALTQANTHTNTHTYTLTHTHIYTRKDESVNQHENLSHDWVLMHRDWGLCPNHLPAQCPPKSQLGVGHCS
jgi:hypothetical protein